MGRTAAPVDRRIKLQRGPEQATITAIDAQTLAVRCPSLGWRVRVPMAGGADAASGLVPYAAPANYARPAAPAIHRGDNVRVSIETESFAIHYSATATEDGRSEEHTSELQSLMRNSYAGFCLKKKITQTHITS